ncbi:MAG: calcium-binding protein [Thermoleophilia bacterium]
MHCDDIGIASITVTLGDQDDVGGKLQPSVTVPLTLNADAGNDTFTGGSGRDTMNGGPGNDTLNGGSGNDAMNGGADNDVLNGDDGEDTFAGSADDPGADTFSGGPGNDTVSYASSPQAVIVRIDDIRNDGIANEDDVRSDVETVIGSRFDDQLIGSAASNALQGGPGSDVLEGLGGNDLLLGTDLIAQDVARDVMRGGDGNDTLVDGGGVDVLEGGDGNDWLWMGPGADVISGGPGIDLADYGQAVYPNCCNRGGLNVSIDGVANDGYPGEGDNVLTDVENLQGGLWGDVLSGGPGLNVISGGAGADTILVRDGAPDVVFCSADEGDTVVADAVDDLLPAGGQRCANVDQPAAPAPAPAPPPAAAPVATPFAALFASTRASGVASVKVTCGAAAVDLCEGVVTLSANGKRVGRELFALEPGATETIDVELASGAVRALRTGKRRLKVTLRASATDNGRVARLVTRTATLRGPKKG